MAHADGGRDGTAEQHPTCRARGRRVAGEHGDLTHATVLGAAPADDPYTREEPPELGEDDLGVHVVRVGEEDEEASGHGLVADRLRDVASDPARVALGERNEEPASLYLAPDRENGDAGATLDLLLRGEHAGRAAADDVTGPADLGNGTGNASVPGAMGRGREHQRQAVIEEPSAAQSGTRRAGRRASGIPLSRQPNTYPEHVLLRRGPLSGAITVPLALSLRATATPKINQEP